MSSDALQPAGPEQATPMQPGRPDAAATLLTAYEAERARAEKAEADVARLSDELADLQTSYDDELRRRFADTEELAALRADLRAADKELAFRLPVEGAAGESMAAALNRAYALGKGAQDDARIAALEREREETRQLLHYAYNDVMGASDRVYMRAYASEHDLRDLLLAIVDDEPAAPAPQASADGEAGGRRG